MTTRIAKALLVGCAALAVLPAAAHAQDAATAPQAAEDDQSGINDIVVTAERREMSLQKTALNITAVTGEDLTARGITSARELLDSVAGLKLTVANPNNYIGLYGTGSAGGSQYGDAVMSFNYGGISLARQIAASSSYYDLERVEVLKGPQGTLYGRNATVGAINVIPARPKDEFSASLSATYGTYNTLLTTGHLNVPLGEGVAARIAFQTTRHDGYYNNGYDDAENYGGRASIKAELSDNLDVLVWGDVYLNRSKGPFTTFRYYTSATQEFIDPNDPWVGLTAPGTCSNQLYCPTFAAASVGGVNTVGNPLGFTNLTAQGYGSVPVVGTDGYVKNDQIIVGSEANLHTAIGTFTAVLGYVKTKIDYRTYSNGLRFDNKSDVDQFTAELRLASDGSGPLKYVLGGYYANENQDAFQNNLQSSGYALLVTPNLKAASVAAFGELTYSLMDTMRLTGGVRYTHDTKSQDGYTTASGLTAANMTTITSAGGTCTAVASPAAPVLFQNTYYFPSNFCVVANSGNYKDNKVTWKVGFEFDFAPDAMFYSSIRTGYRAGGFTVATGNTYRPERLLAYETGIRSRFFDRMVQLNLTGFYWSYRDQQVSQLQLYYLNGIAIGQTSFPSNFNGNLYGAEMDLQFAPTKADRLSVNVLWAKGKYDTTPPVATVNTAALVPQYNLPRNNLPEWVINASYSHKFEFGNGASITPAARLHYESRAVLRIIDPALLTPGEIRNPYAKLDFDLTYNSPDERYSVQLFVKNATDKAVVGVGSGGQVALPTFFRTTNGAIRSATLDPPRTFGVRATAKF